MKYLFAVTRTTGSPTVDVRVCKDKAEAFAAFDAAVNNVDPTIATLTHAPGDFTRIRMPDGVSFEVQPLTAEAFSEYLAFDPSVAESLASTIMCNAWLEADFAAIEQRVAAALASEGSAFYEIKDGQFRELPPDECRAVKDTMLPLMYSTGKESFMNGLKAVNMHNATPNWPRGVPVWDGKSPIPMILHCPNCGHQHIDRDESEDSRCQTMMSRPGVLGYHRCEKQADHDGKHGFVTEPWRNPPHRSHKCEKCNHIWRPCDFETVGVQNIDTRGKADTFDNTQGGPYRLPAAFAQTKEKVLRDIINRLAWIKGRTRFVRGDGRMPVYTITGIYDRSKEVIELLDQIDWELKP